MRSRSYDREFKINAIELFKKGEKTGTQICRDLGIPDSTFWGWLNQFAKYGPDGFTGSGNIKEADKDMHQLKKELEDVKMERDILKKALAIFSKTK